MEEFRSTAAGGHLALSPTCFWESVFLFSPVVHMRNGAEQVGNPYMPRQEAKQSTSESACEKWLSGRQEVLHDLEAHLIIADEQLGVDIDHEAARLLGQVQVAPLLYVFLRGPFLLTLHLWLSIAYRHRPLEN